MGPLGRAWRRGARVGLSGVALLAGCHTVDSTVWNLRELHGLDGSVKRVGRVMSAPEYQTRALVASLPVVGDPERSGPSAKRPRVTRRPLDRALTELLRLGRFEATDPRTAGLQVEFQAWLATEGTFVLVRERAVIGLGAQARRLGLFEPLQRAEDQPGVGPGEVREALEALWQAADARDLGLLRPALEALDALDLDGDGARRALAGLNLLLRRELPDQALREVLEVHLELQRLSVATALGTALQDEEGRVRAATLEGVLGLEGAPRGDLLRSALADRDPHVRRVIAADLRRGLPAGQRIEDWIGPLIALASSTDGQVSVAAIRTMTALAPTGPGSLRPEDWAVWAGEQAEAAEAAALGAAAAADGETRP